MKFSEIPFLRLVNQQLIHSTYKNPKDIVGWMGAMQAQDYNMAKWGIGVRTPQSTEESIEKAIDKGEIIRTHILRPTWHLVSSNDIRWMLELSAPRLFPILKSMCRNLELDDRICKRTNSIIEKLLRNNRYLTREEIMQTIEKKGIPTTSLRSAHIMFHAEISGIVCSGPMQDRKITYALLDERVPLTKKVEREEALGMLVERYFKSHGPATIADFVWWSGLTTKESRDGLKMIESKLIHEKINDQSYYFSDMSSLLKNKKNSIHFLPAFDEFMVGYKDRSASLLFDHTRKTITANGIFKPIIVINGKVEGIWKRTIKKDHILIEKQFFNLPVQLKENDFKLITKKLELFFNKKIKMS